MLKPIDTAAGHQRTPATGKCRATARRLTRSLLTAAVIALTLAPLHEAAAQKKSRSAELSAEEAAAQVQKRSGGQALGVETDEVDGRKVYRVRILTRDGRVREITVDARRSDD